MAKKLGPGDLHERIGFASQAAGSDGAGGTTTSYAEQFSRRAAFVHLRGGEAVLAARLEGRHTLIVRVWRDSQTQTATTDWRIEDKRTGDLFNIRDITPSDDRLWLDFLCEKGVAA